MPSLPTKMNVLLILAKAFEKQKLNFSRGALFHMKTRVRLKYFVGDCSYTIIKLESLCQSMPGTKQV